MSRSRLARNLARLVGRPGTKNFREFERVVATALEKRAGLLEKTTGELAGWLRVDPVPATGSAIDTTRLAAVAEIARRAMGFDPHFEQLCGACALISGNAIEMDTGEGKTLTGAIAAAYLAAAGRRVHVLSINDFLARRDAEWMSAIFTSAGLTAGWVTSASSRRERADAYSCDVVYASVSELGYDVLRDRFAMSKAERVNPVFDAAIVDEADAVLIDEAMSPLVLAGTVDARAADSDLGARIVGSLESGRHFVIDDDGATASFTEEGLDEVERALGGVELYSGEDTHLLTVMNLALHARALVHRDVHYLVKDGAIKLISASRGRIAELQRWPDGLHAAVEAKEGLAVTAQGIILDTITIQDLVVRYQHLAGMSATIVDVADDLLEFYRLPSGRIPRNRPLARDDRPEVVVDSREELLDLVMREVQRHHATGRPVLVGTQSVAESEEVANRLRSEGVHAAVLNAKNDATEAEVIARAGEFGAVTISTQISGRGTDIVLGGRDGRDRDRVVALGGLAVIGLGRYPSRRLDAQLRGRSGRQGDPGVTALFSSLEDELMTGNAPDRMPKPGSAARRRLSAQQRRSLVAIAQLNAETARLEKHRSTWAFNRAIAAQRDFVLRIRDEIMATAVSLKAARAAAPEVMDALASQTSDAALLSAVRGVALLIADEHWTDHLAHLQEIRDGIHLRALAGEHPIDAFHQRALEEFDGWESRLFAAIAEAAMQLTAEDVASASVPATVRRPSATWTYMISDNPLGDAMARANQRRKRYA